MQTLRYYISVGWHMLGIRLKAQMEYPSFLIGWGLSNAMQFLVGIGTLKVLTTQFNGINGWSFKQIAFLYGIGIISHGIVIIFFIQTWGIEWYARNGRFDLMLTRPMNVFFQFSVYNLNLIGVTDLIPGVIIFIYGVTAVRLAFTPLHTLYLLCAILGGVLIRGGIYTAVGSLAFWTKSSRPMIEAVNTLFGQIMMYPLTIFNRVVQALLTFALPLGFIAFYPAAGLLQKPTGFALPGALPLWSLGTGLVMTAVGQIIFWLGMRQYDSAGS